MLSDSVMRREIIVSLLDGLHLRPASLVARRVMQSGCQVRIANGEKSADAASVLDLIALEAANGTRLLLESTGTGADEILEAIAPYFETDDYTGPNDD